MDIRSETYAVIAGLADSSLVKPTTRLTEDLGFDSLDRAELSLQLEDRLTHLQPISDETAQGWRTVEDVVNSVAGIHELRSTEGKMEKHA